MAYEITDEDEQSGEGDYPNDGNAVPSGQGSGVIAANTGALSQGDASNAPSSSSGGGYATIQKYLKANQGQGAPLAESVSQNAMSSASQARTQANQGAQAFQQQLQSQVPTVDLNTVQNLGKTSSAQPYSVTQPTSNPGSAWNVDVQANQRASDLSNEQKQQIKKAATAQYSGPASIEQTGLLTDAYAKAQNAKQLADLSQSEPGRMELLRKQFGNSGYSQGQNRLDQAILQNDPTARAALGRLSSQVGSVVKDVDSQAAYANSLIDPTRQQIDTTRANVNKGLEDALAYYQSALQSGTSDVNQAVGQKNNLANSIIQNYLGGGSNQPALNQMLGLSSGAKFDPRIYQPSLLDYLDSALPAQSNDVLSQKTADDLGILSELAGVTNPALGAKPGNYAHTGGINTQGYQDALLQKLPSVSSLKEALGKFASNYWNPQSGDPEQLARNDAANPSTNVVNSNEGVAGINQSIDAYNQLMSMLSPVYKNAGTSLGHLTSNNVAAGGQAFLPVAQAYNQINSLLGPEGGLNLDYLRSLFGKSAPAPSGNPYAPTLPEANGDGTYHRGVF